MRRILLSLALTLLPALALGQQVDCAPSTPCTTSGPSGTNTGDPAYLAFGKINQWSLTAALPLSITNGGVFALNPTLSIATFGTSASGVVPASGGGATNYLRADGIWSAPSGGTGLTSVGLTMPTGFTVTGSPLIANGTLAVTTALSGPIKGAAGAFTTATAADIYGLFTSGTAATCLNSAGGLTACGASGTTVTIGSTTISGGTVGQVLTVGAGPVFAQVATTGSGSIVQATSPTLVTPALGTPSSVTLTNATGLPIATGVSGLGSGVATSLALAMTGSGAMVGATSPTLVTPALGTPSALTLTNATGLPLTTGVTGALPIANGGTGQTTLAAASIATYGAGTTATHCANWTSAGVLGDAGAACGSGAGGLTVGTTTIASGTNGAFLYNNAGVLNNVSPTGSGSVVLGTSPTLVSPTLGTPASATLTNATGLPLSTGVTGTLQAAQFPTLTGQVTTAGSSLTTTLSPTAITSASGGDRGTLVTTDKLLVTPTGGGTNYYTTMVEVATSVASQGTAITSLPNASTLGGTEQLPGVQSATAVNITPAQIATYVGSNPTGTLTVAHGGTGVATLTGVVKASGTANFAAAASSDVIGLWTTGGTCSATTYLRGDGSCITPGGGGTVTSIGVSVPGSSLFSVSGSPVTASGTIAIATAGTSGGIPYFDSTSTLNTSAALTAHAIVLGGGAGAAPTVLGSLGTTTTLLHGNASGAPTYGAVTLTTDVTGTLPVANGGTGTTTGFLAPRTETLTNATSFTPNIGAADISEQANTQATGTLTANNPTGSPVDAQKWTLRISSTNVQTFAWGTAYTGGTIALPTATTGSSKTDYFLFIYNSATSKWNYIATAAGF